MHDIKAIRENPAAFDERLSARGLEPLSGKLVALEAELRKAITAKQDAETRRNAASKEIGQAKAKGDNAKFEELRAEVAALKDKMEALGPEEEKLRDALKKALEIIPNLPAMDVPKGSDEKGNREVRKWGEPRRIEKPRDHVDIGEGLGGLDFESAAKISGARFAFLKGGLAKLERALAQFMLDLHTEQHGYTEASPPYLVRSTAMYGTGQLPKFEPDLFAAFDTEELYDFLGTAEPKKTDDPVPAGHWAIHDPKKNFAFHLENVGSRPDRLWLIPTSEVPLTNLVREQIVDEAALPMRLTAWTPCFRAEAGAAGRDTRGLIRMHQFHKVELVSITTPDASDAEHERMTQCAEKVLQLLELPYRTMLLCTGDMGFSARKTYDLEVWLPSQNTYREISSCSNCGDFQARRMDARFRRAGAKGTEFVHTLNGSGVAVGRALVAILENHQNEDGSVTIPQVLRPYMRGVERLERP